MINLRGEFYSEAEAIAWRDAMYRDYAPEGYGTHIRIEPKPAMGAKGEAVVMWIATGSRAESCD